MRKRLRVIVLSVFGASILGCGSAPPPAPEPPPPAPVVEVKPPPAPEPPPPEPLKLPAPVKFATGSDVLSAESDTTLKVVLEYLQKKPEATLFRIEGHTDNVGGKEPNQKLSEKRAMSVSRWLVKNGVECKRLVAVGFGESMPVADNNTDDGRSQNRRTVFIDAEIGGKKVSEHDARGKIAGDACVKK